MNRLVHSEAGFLRSMQISSCEYFAFVEGGLDRPFIDRIFNYIQTSTGNFPYKVICAKELPGSTGGKQRLLKSFRHFRRKGLLSSSFHGKPVVLAFIVDKDVDDFTQRKVRSNHLIYSSTYDLEGHLLQCGYFHRALADCALLSQEQVTSIVSDPHDSLSEWVRNWREWLSLCMTSQKLRTNVGCTYDRVSAVNPEPLASVDLTLVADFLEKISTRCSRSLHEITRVYERALRAVDSSIEAGMPMRYFKGKWIGSILDSHLKSTPSPHNSRTRQVGDNLFVSLLGQVGVSPHCKCAAEYISRIQRLM